MRSDDEKRTIAEIGFKTWLSDVLWYHYKWAILGGIGAVAVVAIMLWLSLSVPKNDFSMIIAVSDTHTFENIGDLKLAIGEAVGDVNKDGEIIVNLSQFLLNAPPRDIGKDDPIAEDLQASANKNPESMVASFPQKDYVLYLMDKVNLDIYNTGGRFNAELALEFGGENGAVYLGDHEFFKALGMTGDRALYAVFKTKTFNSANIPDDEFYALSRRALAGLLAKEP